MASSTWKWPHLLLAWLPIGALFATLIITAHPGADYYLAVRAAARSITAAAILGVLAHRLTDRWPWPRQFSFAFLAAHVLAAGVFSICWLLLNSAIESLLRPGLVLVVGNGLAPFMIIGVWIYVMIMGISYAVRATERASRAEALAATSQLDALRAQLNPHFLFNALHTVVQLIPRDPARASRAAEEIAGLLRVTIEEDRDLVSLRDEWQFVKRYLDIETLRFGDRLRIREQFDHDVFELMLPSYSLQTLVENAVRHGAAHKVDPTTIIVSGRKLDDVLHIRVEDDGIGASGDSMKASSTGLSRLRERLRVLHGPRARLELRSEGGSGFTVELWIPQVEPTD